MKSPQNTQMTRLAKAIVPYAMIVELICVVIVVMGIASEKFMLSLQEPLYTVGFGVLGLLYYLLAFRPVQDAETIKQRAAFRLLGLGQTTAVWGLWLALAKWPIGNTILPLGTMFLGIASVYMIVLRNAKQLDRAATMSDILRSAIIIVTVVLLNYFGVV